MKFPDRARMAEATLLTQQGKLAEAMALINGVTPAENVAPEGTIDMAPPVDGRGAWTAKTSKTRSGNGSPFGEFKDRLNIQARKGRKPKGMSPTIPEGASFENHSFANTAGNRPYRLYVPTRLSDRPALIVMLHGCTQSPDDFAAGTRMNSLAESYGFLVAYPAQTQHANAQKCWNWFNSGDQQRDRGEPAIIAGLTREIIDRHDVDSKRVFIAGLSAGGAAAAIMGANYPDLYAAVGVHSGLACGAANDMASAFRAMSQGGTPSVKNNHTLVRTIVFHGDRDSTVHAGNGEQVLAQGRAGVLLQTVTQSGRSAGGARYTRTTERDESGRSMLEHWVLHGAGHAWSGGSSDGSYTDPRGPDASHEMVRFFLET